MNKDIDTKKDIDRKNIDSPDVNDGTRVAASGTPRLLAWLAATFALLSYILLLLTNGIVAMCVAAVGLVLGFIAAAKSRGGLRRLAVTAIIASAVLLAVVGAFVMVINLGLR